MNLAGLPKETVKRVLLGAGALLFLATAPAQESVQQPAQNSSPAARAVRLSYVDGQVKLSQGDQVVADRAVANTPLFEGMQLTTFDDGKAEIQFEDGSVARLAPDSTLTLTVLRGAGASAEAELTVNAGLAYFEFQGNGLAGQFSVRFASSVATTSGFTALRVEMDNPPGEVAVFSGNLHIEIASSFGASVTADLHGGESIALNPADPASYSLAESIEPNSWDAWNSDRDEELTAETASQSGAPDNPEEAQNPAWSDLNANGSWYDVPGQGYIWSPYDAANADFDPYGNGNWIYTSSYGYIWASGYSWGYMPFQCGAWNFYDGFGWGWVPGMGGCNPWWGLGVYGGPNIGIAPIGYRPIPRPPLPPHSPIGHRPVPVVPVHRNFASAHANFPARDGDAQVTIAGSTVRAIQPQSSHSIPGTQGFRATPGAAGAGIAGHTPVYFGSRPANAAVPPRPGYMPPPRAGAGSENHSSSAARSSSGGSSNHSSGSAPRAGGGSAPHLSGGGGGGGGAHTGGHR